MARTISQIAGEFGLARRAAGDPFQKSEEATLQNIGRTLEDIRSQEEEFSAAKGFARSTFEQGVRARREEGILGGVFQEFARARTGEDLAERQFERNLISAGVGADIQEGARETQFGREKQFLTQQEGVRERTDIRQADIVSKQSEQRLGLEQELLGTQADIQSKREETLFGRQQQVRGEQREFQTGTIQQQADIQTQAREQQAGLRETSAFQDFTRQTQLVNQNFDNQITALERQVALRVENLPEELRLKAEFQKTVLQDELALRKQTALDQIFMQSVASLTFNLLKSVGAENALADFFTGGAGKDIGTIAQEGLDNILSGK